MNKTKNTILSLLIGLQFSCTNISGNQNLKKTPLDTHSVYSIDSDGTYIKKIFEIPKDKLAKYTNYYLNSLVSEDGKKVILKVDFMDYKKNNQTNYGLYIFNSDGSNLKTIIDESKDNIYFSLQPKNNKLIYSIEKDAYIIDLNNLEKKNIIEKINAGNFVLSSDNKSSLIVKENSIYMADSLGNNLNKVVDDCKDDCLGISWSGDNKKFIFNSYERSSDYEHDTTSFEDVYVKDLESSKLTMITNDNNSNSQEWLPDGRIIYTSGANIFISNADASNKKKLTNNANDVGYINFFSLSPDNKKVAVIEPKGDLEILDLNGKKIDNLKPEIAKSIGDKPKWSFDGNKVAFFNVQKDEKDMPEFKGIYVINTNDFTAKNILPFNTYVPSVSCDWLENNKLLVSFGG